MAPEEQGERVPRASLRSVAERWYLEADSPRTNSEAAGVLRQCAQELDGLSDAVQALAVDVDAALSELLWTWETTRYGEGELGRKLSEEEIRAFHTCHSDLLDLVNIERDPFLTLVKD
jgi:hypothetical protein